MVACLDGLVHDCPIGCDVRTDQNVVDAEIHATAVVTVPHPIASPGVGIVQIFSQSAMGVGDRRGVEIATHNHGAMLVPLDEFGYRVSLDATNGVVHGKFLRQADVFGF